MTEEGGSGLPGDMGNQVSDQMDDTSGDMMYENYESNDDNNSQDVSNLVQSSKSNPGPGGGGIRTNGSQGTSLLSPVVPLNLKTGGSDQRINQEQRLPANRGISENNISNFHFSPSSLPSPISSPVQLATQSTCNPKSKKSSPVTTTTTSLSLSLPSSNSTASALINATTGTNPVKINNTTPGNFTCCFPVSFAFLLSRIC